MMTTDVEEWRQIPSFPLYEASSWGRVRRKPGTYTKGPRTEVLAATPTSQGYVCYRLMRDSKPHWVTGHTVVCETFHGPKPTPKHEVAHGDGVYGHTHNDNLRWATRAENHSDKKLHGTHREGTTIPWARLTPAKVLEIRARLAQGFSCLKIANEFGVSEGAINGIRIGRNWKHVA